METQPVKWRRTQQRWQQTIPLFLIVAALLLGGSATLGGGAQAALGSPDSG